MVLYLIGTGIGEKGISVKGIETARKCHEVYSEIYTLEKKEELSKIIGKKINVLKREDIENTPEKFLKKSKNIAVLVGGDPLTATTHTDLIIRAHEMNIKTKIIHASSILSSIGETGLSVYKFGKTASIPKPQENFKPESFYDLFLENQKINAHTLFLLDIGMCINDGLKIIMGISEKRDKKVNMDTNAVAVARLGQINQIIKYGAIKDLLKFNYGKEAQCIVIPSKMHFMEEEFLKNFLV
ncbi:MAG: diphthine synthase [Candidatus Nanoarchaeia archaeon]|nr:diphthine synthase [Candidatus Nanoarchaeia archaeon]